MKVSLGLVAVLIAIPLVMVFLCMGAIIGFFWPTNDWTYSA
jgi:hypothetical protein